MKIGSKNASADPASNTQKTPRVKPRGVGKRLKLS